jgi:hypothetical protein
MVGGSDSETVVARMASQYNYKKGDLSKKMGSTLVLCFRAKRKNTSLVGYNTITKNQIGALSSRANRNSSKLHLRG